MVKRIGHLFESFATEENISKGDEKARKNKSMSTKKYIEKHDLNKKKENNKLLNDLKNNNYKTSKYTHEIIYEPKKRLLSKLPYYPDRIMQCSLMNILKPIWIKQLVPYTFANIEGRGIHACKKYVEKIINLYNKRNKEIYYLQLDICKFYYNIVHRILKSKLSRKIKDPKIINILYEIIDSYKYNGEYKYVDEDCGIPLGNYPSGYMCNLYLDSFDRWLKEELKCSYVIRYADDIIIFSTDKEYLHKVLICSKIYLKYILKLKVKNNYRVSNLDTTPLNFIGYTFYKNHTNLRKSIKSSIKKLILKYNKNKVSFYKFKKSISSYYGWLSNADCINLLNSFIKEVKNKRKK